MKHPEGNLCTTCNKIINSSFIEHREKCTNYTCQKCGYVGESPSAYYLHIRKYCFERPCSRCFVMFRNIQELEVHQKTNDCVFKCEYCEKTYANRPNRYRHMKEKHNHQSKNLQN